LSGIHFNPSRGTLSHRAHLFFNHPAIYGVYSLYHLVASSAQLCEIPHNPFFLLLISPAPLHRYTSPIPDMSISSMSAVSFIDKTFTYAVMAVPRLRLPPEREDRPCPHWFVVFSFLDQGPPYVNLVPLRDCSYRGMNHINFSARMMIRFPPRIFLTRFCYLICSGSTFSEIRSFKVSCPFSPLTIGFIVFLLLRESLTLRHL